MANRMYARLHIGWVTVGRDGTRFLAEAGSNARHEVDDSVRVPTWMSQAIGRGESAYVLVDFDHRETVRRIRKG